VLGLSVQKGTFPFQSLPAEIRDYMFELSFNYPNPGIILTIEGNETKTRIRVLLFTRDGDAPLAGWMWSDHEASELIQMPTFHTVFAPLLVSRQFYNEAMPMFFKCNKFFFKNVNDLKDTLAITPPRRREHFTNIAVNYRPTDYVSVSPWRNHTSSTPSAAFSDLAGLPHLTSLDIQIHEGSWVRFNKAWKRYHGVEGMPGFAALRSLRGLKEVKFYQCAKVEAL
jgi:hypothetical protein